MNEFRFSCDQLRILGKLIRDSRRSKGIKQTELAQTLGVQTVSSVSKLENGNMGRQPSLWKLAAIAKVLGFSLDQLLQEVKK